MRKTEPVYGKNDRIEFVLKDSSAKSGYSHHCGYVKRSVVRKRLFRKDSVLYDICEAVRDERYLWHNVPEADIIGVVEWKKDKSGKTAGATERKTGKGPEGAWDPIDDNE